MSLNLIVNENSFVSQAEADSYLCASVRANASWAALGSGAKDRALATATRTLQRQCWVGDKAALNVVATVAVNAGGTGYAKNDVLTIASGTGEAATVKVMAVSSGVVTTVQLTNAGLYSADPDATDTPTGGGGSGCTLDLTVKVQPLPWPRTNAKDKEDNLVTSTAVPLEIKNGTIELAFNLSQDSEVETSGGEGSNEKFLQAGTARIEFFRPTATGPNGQGSTRFPVEVQEWVGQFLSGAAISAPFTSGTDTESQFDDGDNSCLSQGYA